MFRYVFVVTHFIVVIFLFIMLHCSMLPCHIMLLYIASLQIASHFITCYIPSYRNRTRHTYNSWQVQSRGRLQSLLQRVLRTDGLSHRTIPLLDRTIVSFSSDSGSWLPSLSYVCNDITQWGCSYHITVCLSRTVVNKQVTQSGFMLCCAMLCYAVLYCAMLHEQVFRKNEQDTSYARMYDVGKNYFIRADIKIIIQVNTGQIDQVGHSINVPLSTFQLSYIPKFDDKPKQIYCGYGNPTDHIFGRLP